MTDNLRSRHSMKPQLNSELHSYKSWLPTLLNSVSWHVNDWLLRDKHFVQNIVYEKHFEKFGKIVFGFLHKNWFRMFSRKTAFVQPTSWIFIRLWHNGQCWGCQSQEPDVEAENCCCYWDDDVGGDDGSDDGGNDLGTEDARICSRSRSHFVQLDHHAATTRQDKSTNVVANLFEIAPRSMNGGVAIWPFLKLFVRSKIWPFLTFFMFKKITVPFKAFLAKLETPLLRLLIEFWRAFLGLFNQRNLWKMHHNAENTCKNRDWFWQET